MMAEISEGNWSFRDPGDDIPDGSTITGGNFSQAAPDTAILVGRELTIRGGNWCNVRQDSGWTIEGGNWVQKSRCAHLHPEWLDAGHLLPEAEDCPHVIEVDTITIDGVVVDTIRHREDTLL
jgi:hypothetical protein